jgi:hypothetical protein
VTYWTAEAAEEARQRAPWLAMGLSTRIANCLVNAGIETEAQLRAMTNAELLRLPNFGGVCLRQVRSVLEAHPERQVSPQCDNCRFWKLTHHDYPGECHRHAPRPSPASPSVYWIATRAVDWCGEHEPAAADVARAAE